MKTKHGPLAERSHRPAPSFSAWPLRLAGLWLLAQGLLRLVRGPGARRGGLLRLLGLVETWLGFRALASAPATVPELYRMLAGFYDSIAFVWRDKLYPDAYRALDVAMTEALADGGRVLDLGCGTGGNLERLLALGLPFSGYVGVDLSPQMLAQARAKLGGEARAEFRELDLVNEPLPPGDFDLVISTWVFEHLEDSVPVVTKAWQSLAPKGRMLLLFELQGTDLSSRLMERAWGWFNARMVPESEISRYPGLAWTKRFSGLTPVVLVGVQKPG